MIRIDSQPWQRMVEHARSTYPNECCGAMLGSINDGDKQVSEALPLANSYAGAKNARYELRPEDLLEADRQARGRNMDLIGIYHSHPDCGAYFSETSPEVGNWAGDLGNLGTAMPAAGRARGRGHRPESKFYIFQ